MKLYEQLLQYLDAGFPILYIHTYEEIKADRIIQSAVNGRDVIEWNGAEGLIDWNNQTPYFSLDLLSEFNEGLEGALDTLLPEDELNRKILLLKDAVPHFQNPRVIACMKQICLNIECGLDTAIIIVSPMLVIPPELEKYITILELGYLSKEEIREQIQQFAFDQKEMISESLLEKMTVAFKGLSEFEIDNLLASSMATYGSLSNDSLNLILQQKRQMILKSNLLEMIESDDNADQIGGLETLKKWLSRKAAIYQDMNRAMDYGVDIPKGVLIAGVPGCGKSLSARAAANLFHVPLLKLDIGRIMGKYLGESEANLRNAIALAEAISPCVLWIDELEKAFAGANGDGHEVTIRLFGTILTWLQEKKSPVFVIATANDISALPPELFRKGRFDEVFYISLPSEIEREHILRIHVEKRRKQDASKIDFSLLAKETDKYTGADLESVVIEALEEAFYSHAEALSTDIILKSKGQIKPYGELYKEELFKLMEYYNKHKFKSAC